MKKILNTLAAALLAASAAQAQRTPVPITRPPAPVPDLSQRVIELERKVAQLQQAPVPQTMVDAQGKIVGEVLFLASSSSALVALRIRDQPRLAEISPTGLQGGSFSTFYLSSDCSGPGFYRATNWDPAFSGNFWGASPLVYVSLRQRFEEPRPGATPAMITVGSRSGNYGGGDCRAYSQTFLAYQASDLEPITPMAGFTPPFRIRR